MVTFYHPVGGLGIGSPIYFKNYCRYTLIVISKWFVLKKQYDFKKKASEYLS